MLRVGRNGSPVALGVLAYLLVAVAKLATAGFDPSTFVVAGDHYVDAHALRYPLAVQHHSEGYDGQFFYRLALDPLTRQQRDGGIRIDHPAVRQQRLGYPAAAWLLSLGQGSAVPWTLIAVNLLAIAGVAWAAGKLAVHYALSPQAALSVVFYPGFILSLTRDTAEIVATCLGLCCLLAATRGRPLVAALLATAAVFTRESTLLYLAGFGLVSLARGIAARRVRASTLCYLLPVVAYAGWQIVLRRWWGVLPSARLGSDDLSIVPGAAYLRGVGQSLGDLVQPPLRYRKVFAPLALLTVAPFLVAVAWAAARRRMLLTPIGLAWLLYVVLATLFTVAIWRDPYGYWRVLCDVYVLGIVLMYASGAPSLLRRLRPAVAIAWAATAVYVLV